MRIYNWKIFHKSSIFVLVHEALHYQQFRGGRDSTATTCTVARIAFSTHRRFYLLGCVLHIIVASVVGNQAMTRLSLEQEPSLLNIPCNYGGRNKPRS